MARSIPVIYNQLLQQKALQAPLNSLNSTSQVSKWNLWLWITAVSQNLFEQLCDLFQTNIETQIASAAVYTPQWMVSKLLQFQYSETVPQVALNTTNFTINYPTVNPSLQIISQAAVQSNASRTLTILVASGPPGGMYPTFSGISDPRYQALVSYINTWMIPGTQYSLVSYSPDIVYVFATVYYDATYSGVVAGNMDTAINNFLAAIPFDGSFNASGLEEAMLNVAGVKDIVLNNVWVQTASQFAHYPLSSTLPPSPWPYGTYLVNNNNLVMRNWQTYAGYATSVPSGSYQLSSTITYTPA